MPEFHVGDKCRDLHYNATVRVTVVQEESDGWYVVQDGTGYVYNIRGAFLELLPEPRVILPANNFRRV